MMGQRSDVRGEADKPPQEGLVNGNGVELKPNGDGRASEGRQEATGARRGPWRSYKEQVAGLAQRIVDAQRPIRVLQALRWEPAVEEAFRRARGRELPKVGPEEYAKIDLGFEPKAKMDEFESIADEV